MKPDSYRHNDGCANCKFSFMKDHPENCGETVSYCNFDNTYDKKMGVYPDMWEWLYDHIVRDNGICDEYVKN